MRFDVQRCSNVIKDVQLDPVVAALDVSDGSPGHAHSVRQGLLTYPGGALVPQLMNSTADLMVEGVCAAVMHQAEITDLTSECQNPKHMFR